jgi:hypothetical protein
VIAPQVGANQLLEKLRPEESERFLRESEEIQLVLGDRLAEAGDRVTHLVFPHQSFLSLTTTAGADPRSTLEVAMIGNEGALGVSVILGVMHAPHSAIVQGSGPARRIRTEVFLRQMRASRDLEKLVQRSLFVLMQQITITAACTHFHQIEQRLARWLLMSQDRAHASHFPVTQEFLGLMLGVRRAGVTRAASQLQHRELIRYRRGEMMITDRFGLEAAACSCYLSERRNHHDSAP